MFTTSARVSRVMSSVDLSASASIAMLPSIWALSAAALPVRGEPAWPPPDVDDDWSNDDEDFPNASIEIRSEFESVGCASLSSVIVGFSTVPPMITRMSSGARALCGTLYVATTCTTGFSPVPPVNRTEPRVTVKCFPMKR